VSCKLISFLGVVEKQPEEEKKVISEGHSLPSSGSLSVLLSPSLFGEILFPWLSRMWISLVSSDRERGIGFFFFWNERRRVFPFNLLILVSFFVSSDDDQEDHDETMDPVGLEISVDWIWFCLRD